MTEELRPLRREEIQDDARLSEFAFQYEMTDEDRDNRAKDAHPEEILGFFVSGQLAAKAIFLPLQIYLQGVPFAMGGVAGVATWPEHRRGGKVARLLAQGLADMRARGQSVSMLHPFSFAFYRRYGWELTFARKQMELRVTQLPRFTEADYHYERTDDRTRLAPLYDDYARRYNGMLQRDAQWWDKRVLRRHSVQMAVCIDAQGQDQGYVIYQVKDSVFTAFECVFADETARRALWVFIANHDSMAETFKILAPVSDPLPFLLPEPRIKQEIIPYFMARIVDVSAFLERYPFLADASPRTRLTVTVQDDVARWNCGTFCAGPEDATCCEVACDIQTLTAMLFGYQRPHELHRIGRLHGNDEAIAAWERAIPSTEPFLLDFF